MLRGLFVILICFTGCKKEKPEYNETYSKFYGKWRSIDLENPIEFDFGPKVIYYSGYLDRNGRLQIRSVWEIKSPIKQLTLYLRYDNDQTASISYNNTMDTINCNVNLDFVFSGNAEYKQMKMVRK